MWGDAAPGEVCVWGKAWEGPGVRQPRHPPPAAGNEPRPPPPPRGPAGPQRPGRAGQRDPAAGERQRNPFPRCRPPRNFSLFPVSSCPGSSPPPFFPPPRPEQVGVSNFHCIPGNLLLNTRAWVLRMLFYRVGGGGGGEREETISL